MEKILTEFINTFDISLKKFQAANPDGTGISRLTISQLQYIDVIYSLGQPSITEIADKLKFSKASVTTAVNKLCELGYAAKTSSMQDKRSLHVSLTEASRRLVEAKHQTLREYGELIRSALSAEEARQFEATLAKIITLFEDEKGLPHEQHMGLPREQRAITAQQE